MKKSIMLVIASCISINCFGSTIYINSPTCITPPGDNLSGCFLNKTNKVNENISLMQTIHYTNGNWRRSIGSMMGNEPNFYAGFSTSSADMEEQGISSESYSLITGDAQYPVVLENCNIDVTSAGPKQKVLTLVKDGDRLHC